MGAGPSVQYHFRLLLVGKTGSGKSSLGNAILGKDVFNARSGWEAGTINCHLEKAVRDNLTLEVLDSPGFCDPDPTRSDDMISTTISQALAGMSPGPHAVLIVLSGTERYSGDVDKAYKEAKKILGGANLASRIVLVITGGDRLRRDQVNIRNLIDQNFGHLEEMKKDAKGRYVIFNNNARGSENKAQLKQLLEKVQEACSADAADMSYLTNKDQEIINEIVNQESDIVAKNEEINIEEARFKVRQALACAEPDNQNLQRAVVRVRQNAQSNDVNFIFCQIV